ncbi:MAG: alpha-ketoacid dehydrogenase subunit beta [Deltaproteobacteria bacterium]|nr:alpha-ketoacid dehydrogenase subunit beta [Deltaproteobacteria bacterium]
MKEITYKQALGEALGEEMARDEKVFLLGEDIGLYGGVFGVTKGLIDKFGPERVRQTAISESAIIGAAVGAAMLGLRPVAEIMYFDFVAVGMDQIINQAAKIRYMSGGQVRLPLVIRTQAGGGRGKGAQHSQYLEALFCHVPGLKVVAPSNARDAKGLLKSAIRDDCPVLFIENAFLYNEEALVPEGDYTEPLGQAKVVLEGRDLTLVTYSAIIGKCLQACGQLAQEGISTEVIDLRTLVPLDMETILESVAKTNRVVVVHEAVKRVGFGAEVAAAIMEKAFDDLDGPVLRVGAKESPIPFAESLEEVVLPSVSDIKEACLALVGD